MTMKKNNCGPRKGWFDVPDWIFSASCEKHDEYYIKGGDDFDRFMADLWFLHHMMIDAYTQLPKPRRMKGYITAFLYFWGVRIGGKKHFNYH